MITIRPTFVCLAALVLCAPLLAQSGKLSDADFRKVAQSHNKAEAALAKEARHYAGHSREAAEALRNLATIHQELAKEHAGK